MRSHCWHSRIKITEISSKLYENHCEYILYSPSSKSKGVVKGRILIRCQLNSEFKKYTLIGMRRMAQRISTTHATNAHLVCAYADTTSWMLLPLPRAHPVFCVRVRVQSGQTWNFVHVYSHTLTYFYLRSSRLPPSLLRQKASVVLLVIVKSRTANALYLIWTVIVILN